MSEWRKTFTIAFAQRFKDVGRSKYGLLITDGMISEPALHERDLLHRRIDLKEAETDFDAKPLDSLPAKYHCRFRCSLM